MIMWHWLKSNHQSVTSLAAMMVGLIALYVAWDQSRVMRDQQHGAAYPILQVDGFLSGTPDDVSVGVTVSNNGVGPALIESVTMLHNGQEQGDIDAFAAVIAEGYDLSWAGLAGRALAPNQSVTPIRFRWGREDITPDDIQSATTAWNSWELQICYCSVFGRCWETSSGDGARARRVDMCRHDETDIFENLGAAPEAAE